MATIQARPVARPYRDFLTPSLHRSFTNAALISLVLCYVEAVWMGQWDSFMQWFPLGWAGLRTLLLFISTLAIYILRVAQLHVGRRMTISPFDTFKHYCFRSDTFHTVIWYSFSAWFFCEVYIWSASTNAKLAMIDTGKVYERPRLNERPVYLRTMFLCLAVAQSIAHLRNDYGWVQIPSSTKTTINLPEKQNFQNIVTALVSLKNKLPHMLQISVRRVALMSVLGPILYALLLRRVAWKCSFIVARTTFTLPKSSKPTHLPPHVADLFGRFFVEGFLLMIMWEFANAAFGVFVSQEPLKKGRPLTDDTKDPNGSLLAGLKAKKDFPKNTAFRELVLIAYQFPLRRVSLYKDLDRAGGSTWSQLVIVCLGELHAVVKRIQDFQQPSAADGGTQQTQQPLQTLPKIASGLKQGIIFTTPPPLGNRMSALESNFGNFAKAHGQSPGADPLSPRAKKLLTFGTDALLSKRHQEQLSAASFKGRLKSYIIDFVHSPLGPPFRQTFARRAVAVVLGTPYGNLGTIVDAVASIAKLSVCSIKEDSFGKVQSDVPNIIRTFVSTAGAVEGFVQSLPVHWSDVEFSEDEGRGRKVPEVEELLAALRDGLRDIVNEFGEYADTLGLTSLEMRRAKETVAAGSKR